MYCSIEVAEAVGKGLRLLLPEVVSPVRAPADANASARTFPYTPRSASYH